MSGVVFVCWGNICRSPMAERMFERAVADAGLADEVEVSSSGVSSEAGGTWSSLSAARRCACATLPTYVQSKRLVLSPICQCVWPRSHASKNPVIP